MRNGWHKGEFRECISEITSGKSVNSVDEPAAAEDVGVLKTSCVYNGHFDPKENKRVVETEKQLVKCAARKGSIIVSRMNTASLVGASGLIENDYPNLFLPDRLWSVTPKPEIDVRWFALVVGSPEIRRRLSDAASGTSASMKNISQEIFLNMPVSIPPLQEQCKIAEILRTWDEAIERYSHLIKVRERQHSALTHQLVFGQRRLCNFASSTEKTQHRWFELPAKWTATPIGKLAREVSERNGNGDDAEVLSCTKYEGFVRSLEYFKKQVFSDDLSGYKAIQRGDFGFPSNHVEEGSIGLQNIVDVGLVSPIYTVFRFDKKKINNEYAYAVLKTSLYRHIFEVSTSASVDRRGSLRWKEFAKIPFPVPPLAEQEAISEVLADNKKLIEGLKTERQALESQKRGLMQKLLTGEWRVNATGKKGVAA